MKQLLLVLILLSTCGALSAQHSSTPYSSCNWTNMSLDKSYRPSKEDSCLLVASTRHYHDSLREFLDYDYDTTGTLNYFAVYFRGNQWKAVPYASLEALLDLKQEYGDFVVFTEGLGKTFTSGIDRGTRLMRIYAVDELFFDWPTQRPYMKAGKNFRTTYRVSAEVASPYAHFLEELQAYKAQHPGKFKTTTLMFHSMGNLVLMYALRNDLMKHIKPGCVDRVLLNAACVPQRKHAKWLAKLTFAPEIFVTINKRDRNLNGAKLILFRHVIGEKVKKPLVPGVHYVSFSKVLEREHNYYLIKPLLEQKPYLRRFYADIFSGTMPVLDYPKNEK